jgi:hypothetical protein
MVIYGVRIFDGQTRLSHYNQNCNGFFPGIFKKRTYSVLRLFTGFANAALML